MAINPRYLRLIGGLALLWLVGECVLFWLASSTFGVFPTLAFLALKGIGGMMLLATSLKTAMRGFALNPLSRGVTGLGASGFSALGAFLILLPGFATSLLGLALFAPSVRTGILNWIRRDKRRNKQDAIITLDSQEWTEIGVRKTRAPRKPPQSRSPRNLVP